MIRILAIECSAEVASVALRFGNETVVLRSGGVQTHSQSLLPMVQQVLAETGVSLAQCDAVAFGCGPGSFTGVRTACGTAQGLAFGARLPVVPVVTLLAMAQRCRDAGGTDSVVPVLDARMGEVYWAQYRYNNGWDIVVTPTLSVAEQVRPDGLVSLCGNGIAAYAQAFTGFSSDRVVADIMPDAGEVALLASVECGAGRTIDPRDAQPLYLRNKVALTTAERAAKVTA